MPIKDEKLEKALSKAAPKVEAAKPKTSSAVLSIVRLVVLPILPGIVSELLRNANSRTKSILRETRDVLVAADLGDE